MKVDIFKHWLSDIPHQFLAKKNIEIFIKAFSKQLDEIYQVYQDLNLMTDIDTAVGKNLDYVGTIIPLTRKEAGEMAGIKEDGYIMSDDLYRRYLKYKKLVNTNDCTYYDMMEGIKLLWGDYPLLYKEDPEFPATITLTMPVIYEYTNLTRIPIIKPAGVGVILELEIRESTFYVGSLFLFGEMCEVYPYQVEMIELPAVELSVPVGANTGVEEGTVFPLVFRLDSSLKMDNGFHFDEHA